MTAHYYADLAEETRHLSFKYGIPLMLSHEYEIHSKRYERLAQPRDEES